MKRVGLFISLLTLALVLSTATPRAAAVGSVVVTQTTVSLGNGTTVYQRISVAWTSSSMSGAVSGNPFAIPRGWLTSIRFIPGGTAPSDLYDVTLVDIDGTISSGDLLSGVGADQSATLANLKTFSPPIFEDGTRTLDLVIANAGNSKTGTVVILVQTK
jgi:hypothetical protein